MISNTFFEEYAFYLTKHKQFDLLFAPKTVLQKKLPQQLLCCTTIIHSHELFNIMVNQNFNPFIESLIHPLMHFSLSDLPGFTFFVSFKYFSPPTDKKCSLPQYFGW